MRSILLMLAMTALFLGSTGEGKAAEEHPDPWREDLRFLVQTLEARHPDLYHTVSRERFRSAIDALADRASYLHEHAVITELARAVAMVGDGHTLVNLLWDRRLPFRRLPVGLARAADGLVVLEATPEHIDLLGARVDRVGNVDAAEAFETVRPLFAHDNEWSSLRAVDLLQVPEILHGVGIVPFADSVELEIETAAGERRVLTMAAVARNALGHALVRPAGETPPLWLRDREDRYWLHVLPERRALYVAFNGADRDKEEESLAEFGRRMERTVRDGNIERIIVDLRWNAGGSRWRARHLLNALIRLEGHFGTERTTRYRKPSGRLFTITGPRTFSAATQFALDLDLHTNTVFIGQPTGGKPNHYGELGRFRLPNSELEIRHSEYFHQASHPSDDRPAISPDISVVPTVEDYRAGRDPALDAVWTYKTRE